VALSVFIMPFNKHCSLVPEIFITWKKKCYAHWPIIAFHSVSSWQILICFLSLWICLLRIRIFIFNLAVLIVFVTNHPVFALFYSTLDLRKLMYFFISWWWLVGCSAGTLGDRRWSHFQLPCSSGLFPCGILTDMLPLLIIRIFC
jgi:hypothetical protein